MMKNNDELRELYNTALHKVHASDELLRKVENMNNEKVKSKKIIVLRRALCVAAAVVVLFALSNVVALAATGETWVEHVFVRAVINGEEQDMDVLKTTDEDGNTSYEMTYEDDDGMSYGIVFDGDEFEEGNTTIEIKTNPSAEEITLVEENGRIYLDWPFVDAHEDITDDFADGKADVKLTGDDGSVLTIHVEGTLDEYTISFGE